MFLWIFWSYIDSCRNPFLSKATLNVPTSHGSKLVGRQQSLIWYDPWKNQVLFCRFQIDAIKASWLSGSVSAHISCDTGSILRFVAFFLLSFTKASSLKNASKHRHQASSGGRVVSVATLPVMASRLGWGSWFKSANKIPWAGRVNELFGYFNLEFIPALALIAPHASFVRSSSKF